MVAEWSVGVISVILTVVGVTAPTIDYTLIRRAKHFVSPYLSLLGILASLLVSIDMTASLFARASSTTGDMPALSVYGGLIKLDIYGSLLVTLALLASLLVLIASLSQVRRWSTSPSFYSLLPLALLGVVYLILVDDLVLLLASWALVAVASYVIAGIKKDEASLEGAVKYAIMGAVSSVLILYSIAAIYGATGTTRISEIQGLLRGGQNEPLVLISLILFAAAFGFKIGVVPFHGWLPDVYGGVHPILVSFIAGVVKIGGIAAMLRVLLPISYVLPPQWFLLFSLLSLASMFFGNLAALVQRGVQRMMAYSSIAHVGYILIGLAAFSLSPTARYMGSAGIALHLSSYVFAKVGIFVALSYLLGKGVGLSLEKLSGLGKRAPLTSLMLAIILLNLMGMPPLLGFWGKFYLFASVVMEAPWLTVMAILNSAISVAYYAQVIRYMYFAPASGEGKIESLRDPELIVLVISTAAIIIAGLGPALILAPSLKLAP